MKYEPKTTLIAELDRRSNKGFVGFRIRMRYGRSSITASQELLKTAPLVALERLSAVLEREYAIGSDILLSGIYRELLLGEISNGLHSHMRVDDKLVVADGVIKDLVELLRMQQLKFNGGTLYALSGSLHLVREEGEEEVFTPPTLVSSE